MRNSNGRGVKAMLDAAESSPPVPAIEALRRNLLYAMFKGVATGDMTEIVAAQVKKAKGGDPKAARLIMDMTRASDGGSTVHMQQAIICGGKDGAMVVLSELRQMLVRIIASQGAQRAEVLAAQLEPRGVLRPRVESALEHEWFEREADGWHITAKARAEVLEEAE